MAEEKKTEEKKEMSEVEKFALLTPEQQKDYLKAGEKAEQKKDLKKKGIVIGGVVATAVTVIGSFFLGKHAGEKNSSVSGSSVTTGSAEPFTTVDSNS
jgi:hypothetical protein